MIRTPREAFGLTIRIGGWRDPDRNWVWSAYSAATASGAGPAGTIDT